MPLYNKRSTVTSAVNSVRLQTQSDWELVIVDDGSTDDGPMLVRKIADPRIRLYSQKNCGVSAARNLGIEHSKAPIIAFLDADDVWHRDFLDRILQLQSDYPSARWFATSYEIVSPGGDGRPAKIRGVVPGFQRGILNNYFVIAAVSDPPVWTSTVCVSRMAIRAAGEFPVGLDSGEDLITWARLAVCSPLAYDRRISGTFNASGIERPPDPLNRVGLALEKLAVEFQGVPGLRAYVGLWYRMQSTMALRLGDLRCARDRARRSLYWAPGEIRGWYGLFMSWIPISIGVKIDGAIRRRLGQHVGG